MHEGLAETLRASKYGPHSGGNGRRRNRQSNGSVCLMQGIDRTLVA